MKIWPDESDSGTRSKQVFAHVGHRSRKLCSKLNRDAAGKRKARESSTEQEEKKEEDGRERQGGKIHIELKTNKNEPRGEHSTMAEIGQIAMRMRRRGEGRVGIQQHRSGYHLLSLPFRRSSPSPSRVSCVRPRVYACLLSLDLLLEQGTAASSANAPSAVGRRTPHPAATQRRTGALDSRERERLVAGWEATSARMRKGKPRGERRVRRRGVRRHHREHNARSCPRTPGPRRALKRRCCSSLGTRPRGGGNAEEKTTRARCASVACETKTKLEGAPRRVLCCSALANEGERKDSCKRGAVKSD
ncbi:hypothetical protein C8R46DRAFT_1099381 [Mycena filopes]|nr:hypothetical protein C8R46DRAFT_1099381 [Mycena filopes]